MHPCEDAEGVGKLDRDPTGWFNRASPLCERQVVWLLASIISWLDVFFCALLCMERGGGKGVGECRTGRDECQGEHVYIGLAVCIFISSSMWIQVKIVIGCVHLPMCVHV